MSQPGEKSFRDSLKDADLFQSYINFNTAQGGENPQTVIFDPAAVVRVFKGGQYGDSPAVPVEKNGQVYWLRIKAAGLRDELAKVKQRSTVSIERFGSGTGTRYKVKVVK